MAKTQRFNYIYLATSAGWFAVNCLCGFFASNGNDNAQMAAMMPAILSVMLLFPLVLLIAPTPNEYHTAN